ncbi:MAG: FG-GAP-like repeat-containing protein [Planctomycetota bacterium]
MRSNSLPVALLFASFLSTAGSPALAQSGSSEEANVSGFYGSLGNEIPISVPNFRSLTPPLKLIYNSTGRNGWLGVGWSVSGLSVIQRGADRGGVPNYSSAGEVFYLDGQRLVDTNLPLNGTDATHATEIQGFLHIKRSGANWDITNKNGTHSLYEPLFTTSQGTFRWYVTQVTDVHGNQVLYNYDIGGGAEPWVTISSITYNQAEVHFRREARPDPTRFGIGTGIAEVPHRLAAIDVFVLGQRIRSYRLDYEQSSLTGRSQLVSVKQYGRDAVVDSTGRPVSGTSLPPSTFDYAPGLAAAVGEGTWNQSFPANQLDLSDIDFFGGRMRTGDFNGDGRMDLLYGPDETNRWYVGLSNGDRFGSGGGAAFPVWAHPSYPDWGVPGEENARLTRIRVGDVDGDGKSDVVMGPDGAGNWYVMRAQMTGGFSPVETWIAGTPYFPLWSQPNYASAGIRLADLNADGKDDLVLGPEADGGMQVMLSTGSSFVDQGESWGTFSYLQLFSDPEAIRARVRILDVTADGRPDLLIGPSTNGVWRVARNAGNRFLAPTQWYQMPNFDSYWAGDDVAGSRIRNADVNGDGMPDIIIGPNHQAHWWVLLNTGTAFVHDGAWVTAPNYGWLQDNADASADMRFTDVNGDRMADILIGPDPSARYYVLTSTGHSFVDQGTYGSNVLPGINMPSSFWHNTNEQNRKRLIDVTGDGIADVTYGPDRAGKVYVVRMGTRANKGDLLESTTNGLGGTSDIVYAPSSDWEDNQLPIGLVLQTVESIETSDGRNNSSIVSYQYERGLWSQVERRFLGFQHVTSVIDADGTYVETIYSQSNGSVSKPLSSSMYAATGELLRNTQYGYTENATKPYTSFLTTMTTWESEIGPFPSMGTRSTYVYEPLFGNLISHTDHGSPFVFGDETTEQYYFTPNTDNYVVALPNQITLHEGLNVFGPRLRDSRIYYDDGDAHGTSPKRGNETRVERWDGQTGDWVSLEQEFDDYGNIISITDENGKTSRTEYDTVFNIFPIRQYNEAGHLVQTAWDAFLGVQGVVIDPNNQRTENTYDPLGRLETVETPNGHLETIEHVNTGDPTQQFVRRTTKTNATTNETVWTETYIDGLGRKYMTRTKGPGTGPHDQYAQMLTEFTDASERPLRASLGHFNGETPVWSEYEYDEKGRLVTVRSPDATDMRLEYSINGDSQLVETRFDATGEKHETIKDSRGNVVEIVEHDGSNSYHTTYEYDPQNRLIKTIDDQNNETLVFWDSLDRKVLVIDPDLGVQSMDHDDRGMTITSIDAKNQVSTAIRDQLGRVTSRSVDGVVQSRMFYDDPSVPNSIGRMTRVEYPGGSVNYLYDSDGNISREDIEVDGVTRSFHRTYDFLGRITSLTYPDGEVDVFTYDAQGRLKSTSAVIQNMEYTAEGRLEFVQYRDGSRDDFTYDPDRRWLDSVVIRDALSVVAYDATFDYYAHGLLRSSTSNSQPLDNVTYSYDGLRRLTDVSGARNESFTYDSIGNMRTSTKAGTLVYTGSGSGPHAVTAVLSPQGKVTRYLYDGNGNLIERDADRFKWDEDDRMIEASVVGSNGRSIVSEFEYDGTGNRIREKTDGVDVLYFGDLLEVVRRGDNILKETKQYHADYRVVGRKDVGSGSMRSYHSDRLSNVRVVTQGGAVVDGAAYSAFGEFEGPAPGAKLEHSFGGHRFDEQTGLHYMKARYYDSTTGRFISPDSMIPSPYNPQSLNRYSYVLNNPISYTDPTGHAPVAAAFIGAAAVTNAGAGAAISTLAWIGAATTTVGYINEDPELIAIGQILTGFATGFSGAQGANVSSWGTGWSGGLHGAAFAYSQSPISPLTPAGKIIVGWAFADYGNYGQLDPKNAADVAKAQHQWPSRLTLKLGAYGAEKVTGAPAGSISMALSGLTHLREANLEMRRRTIVNMLVVDKLQMALGHSNGVQGIWGNSLNQFFVGLKVAGGRRGTDGTSWLGKLLGTVNDTLLGGDQLGRGSFFGIPYEAGSSLDVLLESFAGPHDFISGQLFYTSNGRFDDNGFVGALTGPVVTTISFALVIPAAPFAAGLLLALPSEYWNTAY